MPVIYNSDDYDRIAGEIIRHAKEAATTSPLPKLAIIPVSYTDPYKLEPYGVAQVEKRMRSRLDADTDDCPVSWCRVNSTTDQFFFQVK